MKENKIIILFFNFEKNMFYQKNLLDLNNDKKEKFEMEKNDLDCHIENIEEKKI